jgi:hypothetical protein
MVGMEISEMKRHATSQEIACSNLTDSLMENELRFIQVMKVDSGSG